MREKIIIGKIIQLLEKINEFINIHLGKKLRNGGIPLKVSKFKKINKIIILFKFNNISWLIEFKFK